MGGESFCLGNFGCQGAQTLPAGFIQSDEAGDLAEIEDVERRGKTRTAAGGHHVARPSDIIPQHLEGIFAQEQAAGVMDARRQQVGFGDRQAQVLGSVGVCQGGGAFQIGGQHDAALVR